MSVAWSADQRRALSGSDDKTVRLWDVETGRCLRVLEGHTDWCRSVAWSADRRRALSGSADQTVRLWDVRDRALPAHTRRPHKALSMSVAWSADQRRAFSGDVRWRHPGVGSVGICHRGTSTEATRPALPFPPDQVQYTNAKVLFVGESGVGKTGLSMRLASNDWEPSDSTVGAWATQWKLPVVDSVGVAQVTSSGKSGSGISAARRTSA